MACVSFSKLEWLVLSKWSENKCFFVVGRLKRAAALRRRSLQRAQTWKDSHISSSPSARIPQEFVTVGVSAHKFLPSLLYWYFRKTYKVPNKNWQTKIHELYSKTDNAADVWKMKRKYFFSWLGLLKEPLPCGSLQNNIHLHQIFDHLHLNNIFRLWV